MKATIAFLVLLVLMVFRNGTSAGSELTVKAAHNVEDIDATERTVKPLLNAKAPAGASAQFRSAWQDVVRKAEDVHACCEPARLYAEKIVRGDESKETIDVANKWMHKLGLAVNAFTEAVEKLKRIRQDEK